MLSKPYTLLIPAAGEGSRFVRAGYEIPKPLLPLKDGRPMIQHVIEDCIAAFGKPERLIIAIKPNIKPAMLAYMKEFNSDIDGVLVEFPHTTRGASETVLLSLLRTRHFEGSLVVANSDQRFTATLPENFDEDWDGVLTFDNDFSEKWSYLDTFGSQVVEKPLKKDILPTWRPTCGVYYFSDIGHLLSTIARDIAYDERHGPNKEFYLAPQLASPAEIRTQEFVGLGTPEDYELYMERMK